MAWIRCTGNTGGSLKVRTASGAIASFETNMADVLQEVKCSINPIQDLHGEDKPYPAGGGTQKFNGVWEDGYINASTGAVVLNYGYKTTDFIKVLPNTQYYCIATIIASDTPNICYYDNNKNKILYESSVSSVFNNAFTTPNDADIRYMRITITLANISIDNFSINYPSTDHDYHPYANVCPIEGYTEANITRCGVNLFDKTNVFEGYINDANGNYSANANYKCTDYIPVKGGLDYYVKSEQSGSNRGAWYDKDKNYIEGLVLYTNRVKTAPANACYARLTIWASGSGDVDTFGFNYPATDTAYHAYNGQTYTIAFGQMVFGGQLIILPDRTYFHGTHGVVDLGSLDWTPYNDTFLAQLSDAYMPESMYTMPDLICEIYSPDTFSHILDKVNDNTIGLNSYQSRIHVYDSSKSSVTETQFKTSMSGIKAKFRLATPFDIDLTPVQIEQLLGKNNVWHDANGDAEVKYLEVVRN